MLKGVVSMPSNIFATTGTNVSVLFIDKSNTEGQVLLMDASKLGTKVKDGKNQKTVLSVEEENQIIDTFNNNDVIHGIVPCPTLDSTTLVVSYNDFKTTISKTQNLEHCYLLKDKTKFINNYAMSNMGHNV